MKLKKKNEKTLHSKKNIPAGILVILNTCDFTNNAITTLSGVFAKFYIDLLIVTNVFASPCVSLGVYNISSICPTAVVFAKAHVEIQQLSSYKLRSKFQYTLYYFSFCNNNNNNINITINTLLCVYWHLSRVPHNFHGVDTVDNNTIVKKSISGILGPRLGRW